MVVRMSDKSCVRRQTKLLSATVCALAAVAIAATPAWAVNEHTFDPTLSLRGNCATSTTDEVPDPGLCPMPPGVPGVDHPLLPFEQPCGTATDPHGDIYVASAGAGNFGNGTDGRIDVFGPNGEYLAEVKDEHQPCSIAVDSEGTVYVAEYAGKNVVRFTPDSYPPTPATEYGPEALIFKTGDLPCKVGTSNTQAVQVAVDPSNDHLYITLECEIAEYESAAAGNGLITEGIGVGLAQSLVSVGVYGKNHDVYATAEKYGSDPGHEENARAFIFDGTDGHVKCEINGAEAPDGGFGFVFGKSFVAVDQANGDFYVDDVSGHDAIDQFDAGCKYVGQLKHSFAVANEGYAGASIAVDDPIEAGEAGYDSPNPGYVYVTSGNALGNSHLYAFAPRLVGPPEVNDQTADVNAETEVLLRAKLRPHGLDTHYHFEYTTETDFQAGGYAKAASVPVPDADAGQGGAFESVLEPVTGLEPGTAYRFRLVASNEAGVAEGEGGKDASFTTYFPDSGLPDNRAYELVTPPDTDGRVPTLVALGEGFSGGFNTSPVSSDGKSLLFATIAGSLPGIGGGGYNDAYTALRGPGGWKTSFAGVSGAQAQKVVLGGASPDHGYSLWQVSECKGSLGPCVNANYGYVRRPGGVLDPACSPEPEGLFEFTGCGSLGADPRAVGKWIAADGSHVIFIAGTQLEPEAAPTGTAIYDRTPDGVTHVVSLKPGGGSFGAGEGAEYLGASADGTVVAFRVKGTVYVRPGGAETQEVASGGAVFGGLSRHGNRLFYLRPNSSEPLLPGTEIPRGKIFAFDTEGGGGEEIGSGDEAVLVNISPDGTGAYFVSPQVLTPGEENGQEAEAESGKENLYAWDGEAVHFIADVEPSDVSGEPGFAGSVGGLGLWIPNGLSSGAGPYAGPANDPSRVTSEGSVLVFESRASLSGYENAGHREIYRYDAGAAPAERLICLSCNPTGSPAASDSQLESDPAIQLRFGAPVNALTQIPNVTSDGKRVFFQSADRLAAGDGDGLIDVYEWEAQGAGGCERETGCLHLISGGRSSANDYLYAMTPNGSDVFFESADLLVPEDPDHTPSIYDARVEGGFPAPPTPSAECLGEACQPAAVAPGEITPATSGKKPTNPKATSKPRCPDGKRKVRRHGRTVCAKSRGKSSRRHDKHERAHVNRRAAR